MYPPQQLMFGLIVFTKLLPRDMFGQLPNQMINHVMRDRDCWSDAQNVPLKGLQQLTCDASSVRSPVVVQQADSSCQHSSPFVLNCSLYSFQSHGMQQHLWCLLEAGNREEEANSCPKQQLPWFSSLMFEVLNFFTSEEWVWRHCTDCHLVSGVWWNTDVSSRVTINCTKSSPFSP